MYRLLRVSVLTFCLVPALAVAQPVSRTPSIDHHQLTVELRPDSHQLIATDRLTVSGGASGQELAFSSRRRSNSNGLRMSLAVRTLASRPLRSGSEERLRMVRQSCRASSSHNRPAMRGNRVRLRFTYRGVVGDPLVIPVTCVSSPPARHRPHRPGGRVLEQRKPVVPLTSMIRWRRMT